MNDFVRDSRASWLAKIDWSVVRVLGADAIEFVHRFCTADLRRLQEQQATEAFFTDVKGRIIAHAIVVRTAEGCDAIITSPRAKILAEHLERHHIREKLEISLADDVVNIVGGEEIAAKDAITLAGLSGARIVLCDIEPNNVLTALEFDYWRISQGFPLDARDFSATTLPQEVNRDELAISFNKGCYLGQETVARIDALGHVNKLLALLEFEAGFDLNPESKLTRDGKEVGSVTSFGTDGNHPLGLAYVKRELYLPGAIFDIDSATARVLSFPWRKET